MKDNFSPSLYLPPQNLNHLHTITDFNNFITTSIQFFWHQLKISILLNPNRILKKNDKKFKRNNHNLSFSSTSLSIENPEEPTSQNWLKIQPAIKGSSKVKVLLENVSDSQVLLLMFVYFHLILSKQSFKKKGLPKIYNGTFDAIVKIFLSSGILGFYRGVSAVIVGSTFSSALYFGTCEFGKSVLSKVPNYPAVLIPPTAGAMSNIVSSVIMVPKELITQRMQTGAKGRSWEVLVKILQKDGVLGLYAGYSATLLRNLPAGVLSYSSFEYLKSAVLSKTGQENLEPLQSVCCGALAGAISASITTPIDVTRLMTQVQGETKNKVYAVVYSGVNETVKQILKEEGWAGFSRGMGPRVVHSACFVALVILFLRRLG
ncbi:hypothetical protein MKX01_005480 [Papaver californicum]|nr:hypothetical protein MKX01_005480 [Papaver californicum]